MQVIGVGDNVVDKYKHIKTMFPGGNALNFAVYAKIIGVKSAYMGVVGKDQAGCHIMKTLSDLGLDTSKCKIYEGETGYAEVDLVDGDRVFVGSNKGGISKDRPLRFSSEDINYLKEFDLIHTSCYSFIEEEMHKLSKIGNLISFDFSNKTENSYIKKICKNVDFSLFSASHLTLEQTYELLKKAHCYGSSLVLASRGVDGQLFYDGDKYYKGEVDLVKPLDTLGAGDSFVTKFLITLLENGWEKNNLPSEDTIKIGLKKSSLFASKTCLVQGAFGHGLSFE